ncbi:MAG: carbonic anhydrase family protein [Myxococcales bacterium]|nr:carbonic anhydrase family protein [Myxococcales bacterium]
MRGFFLDWRRAGLALSTVTLIAGAPLGGCATGPRWAYEGPDGPSAWGQLDPAYAACASGQSQSPIDIVEVVPRDLPEVRFRYGTTPVRLTNTGRTVEQTVAPGSSIAFGAMTFALETIQFHAPSEHRAAGQSFPMELQWVHRSARGHLAVVAVMVKEGRPNPALAMLLGRLPRTPGEETGAGPPLSLASLLPKAHTYIRYTGSLTTPPCWENVQWLVLTEPLEASREQIASFTALYPNNVRPVKPVGRRTVFFDATP